MPDLLIELFSEEIPARMQRRAGEDLKKIITNGLVEAGLTYVAAAAFTTSRRLTLTVEGLLANSPTVREERKGPRADASEKAVGGFLRGVGLTRDEVEVRGSPKGDILFAVIEKPGRPAVDIISQVLEHAIRNFPWQKSMRWGTGTLKWVRPLQSILCILSDDSGATVVPITAQGIAADNKTQGHRFMAPKMITVTGFDDYRVKLKRAYVILDPDERAQVICHDATNVAFASGLELIEDKNLLAEVSGLVEWPVVLMGRINSAFRELPAEVLQTSMREHQKFFSVRNPKTDKIENFITVANREAKDSGATILAGNEKVLSARLADAKFFWENDLIVAKSDLSIWTKALKNVTFHNKLGTQFDRVKRIEALASNLALAVGADIKEAEEGARWAKVDLNSEMVYEFPELQGTMGSYYIKASGRSLAVAVASKEHYSPLGPSDSVPTAPVSVVVALADKLDTLTGFWAIDEKPTGSKDPFALRRGALGVIRLVIENNLTLKLTRFVELQLLRHEIEINREQASKDDLVVIEGVAADAATDGVLPATISTILDGADTQIGGLIPSIQKSIEQVSIDLLNFVYDRLKVYLRDQGFSHDVIDACIAMDQDVDLTSVVKRIKALSEALKTDDGENLIQGYKRANNILSQAEHSSGVEYSYGADLKFMENDEERALFAALDKVGADIAAAMKDQDFTTAMTAMASLRMPIDAFFETTLINADNEIVRRNRLNMLSRIRTLCLSVADLNKLDG